MLNLPFESRNERTISASTPVQWPQSGTLAGQELLFKYDSARKRNLLEWTTGFIDAESKTILNEATLMIKKDEMLAKTVAMSGDAIHGGANRERR